MKRFVCLKANTESLADSRMARDLNKRAPIFYLYDPAAKLFTTLEGKKASSRSRFYGAVEKLWKASFVMKLKDFTKKMSKVLDEIDKIEKKKELLAAKKARAAGNASKLGVLNRQERKLKEEEKKIHDREAALLESCRRKPEFLAEAK
jgi:cell shape-determining protein MreC